MIALVTSLAAAGRDDDSPVLIAALAAIGIKATEVAWDDPQVDWRRFDAAIIRSAWGYHHRLQEFLAWIDAVSESTVLLNSPATIRANVDKRYLAHLAASGLPTVPTAFVEPGDDLEDLDLDGDLVVKPTVSAGSNNTDRFRDDRPLVIAAIDGLLAVGRTVMVQPYQSAIDEHGETALVFVGGRFSHAILKEPILADVPDMGDGPGAEPPGEAPIQNASAAPSKAPFDHLFAEERVAAAPAVTADQRALADAVMAWVAERFGAPLYARVDMVPGADDRPALLELELVEPSLFLHTDPDSPARFAAAIAEALRG